MSISGRSGVVPYARDEAPTEMSESGASSERPSGGAAVIDGCALGGGDDGRGGRGGSTIGGRDAEGNGGGTERGCSADDGRGGRGGSAMGVSV